MANTQNNKNYDFFKTTSEKINNTSFKKILFLSLAHVILLSLAIPYAGRLAEDHIAKSTQEEKIEQIKNTQLENEKNRIELLKYQYSYNIFREMNENEFNNFMSYMHFHQNTYDETFTLISDSIFQTMHDNKYEKDAKKESWMGLDKAEYYFNFLTDFKNDIEEQIIEISEIYLLTHKNAPVNKQKLYLSLKWYERYLSKTHVIYPEMEEEISDYLYTSYSLNNSYNKNNNIVDKYKDLKKIKKEEFEQLFINNKQPKLKTDKP